MDIKEKITCIACDDNFYVVVTDNGEVYDWNLEYVIKCSLIKDFIGKPLNWTLKQNNW